MTGSLASGFDFPVESKKVDDVLFADRQAVRRGADRDPRTRGTSSSTSPTDDFERKLVISAGGKDHHAVHRRHGGGAAHGGAARGR